MGVSWSDTGVNLSALRGHNAALALDLLRAAGRDGISRLELAERTGLTPQAVSKITARLRAAGLVSEAGHRASTGGKPRTVLRLAPSAGCAVGVRLDRDALTAVLLDLAGERVRVREAPLDVGGEPPAVLARVADEVGLLLRGERPPGLLGAGVAMPGPLDHASGVARRVTGFPHWDGFPVRDTLAALLGCPVVLDKDTNAAALGLALSGVAGESDSFAYLHLGTGLGAGLVLGGGLYRGARTGAGEFGHQTVQLDGPECRCGRRGCIEALCLDAVRRGEPERAARILGAGAANLVALLDIGRIVLGGRIVAAAPEVFTARVAEAAGVPVALADGGAHPIAGGAAQLILAPLFGRGDPYSPKIR
ncbi:ROK family transcriptional regulator [Streptomyces katsurahamanus]|uniref:ROK family transcriptional regulator n=1 Tax=Streptomyces katsurahamanus TaxID=2577098 RepID=UPI003899D4A5